jgi:hypothetical protein
MTISLVNVKTLKVSTFEKWFNSQGLKPFWLTKMSTNLLGNKQYKTKINKLELVDYASAENGKVLKVKKTNSKSKSQKENTKKLITVKSEVDAVLANNIALIQVVYNQSLGNVDGQRGLSKSQTDDFERGLLNVLRREKVIQRDWKNQPPLDSIVSVKGNGTTNTLTKIDVIITRSDNLMEVNVTDWLLKKLKSEQEDSLLTKLVKPSRKKPEPKPIVVTETLKKLVKKSKG